MRGKLRAYRDFIRTLGLRAGVMLIVADASMFVAKRAPRMPRSRLATLRIPGHEHPLWFRWFTSDVDVIRQIFCEREYDPIHISPPPDVIVDCGANIGCSAVWFLTRYPDARVICVEPAPSNVEVCRRNVAPWGDAVEVLTAAVWSSHEHVVLRDPGEEWMYFVQPDPGAPSAETRVMSLTVDDLLARSPAGQIDLLKMDVEGAEREIFSEPGKWLDAVRNLVIELHDDEAAATFFAALEPYSYDLSRSGELTACTSLRRLAAETGH